MSLLLVGVGHVFRIEEPVQAIIHGERAAVVALELDANRYRGLLERANGTYDAEAAARGAPALYRRLARFQEDVAAGYGTKVGGEMLAAAQAAKEAGSRIALIDRNAQDLVTELWSQMGLRERLRLLASAFMARFPGKRKDNIEKELQRYQDEPTRYLEELGRSYPTLKRVLLDERNQHMASELRRLLQGHGSVVAVLGDGHVDGVQALLKDLEPRVIRLAQLRTAAAAPSVQWNRSPGADKVTFSFDQAYPDDPYGRDPS